MTTHARVLGLLFLSYADHRGCRLQFDSTDDHRVVGLLQGVSDQQGRFWTHRPGQPNYDRKIEHLLRAVAGVRCLCLVNEKRYDAEDILDVDVDAESNPIFKRFLKRLDEDDRRLVRIYRSGAVSSETRRCSGQACRQGRVEAQTSCLSSKSKASTSVWRH